MNIYAYDITCKWTITRGQLGLSDLFYFHFIILLKLGKIVCLVRVYETLKSEKEEADEEYSYLNQWCFLCQYTVLGQVGHVKAAFIYRKG